VTKTPRRSAKIPSTGIFSGTDPRATASTTAWRARPSNARLSASERNGILGLLTGFHQTQLPALLDAVVHVAPEAKKILRGGNQRAHDDQPQEQQSDRLQRRMSRARDQ